MKRCPACQSTYSDDSLVYCLQDGTVLREVGHADPSADYATLVLPAPGALETEGRRHPEQGTAEVFPRLTTPVTQSPAPTKRARVVVPAIIVTVLALAVGGFGAWALFKEEDEPGTNATSESQNRIAQRNNSGAASNASATSNNAAPTSASPTVDVTAARNEVVATLNRWAQTIRDRDIDEHMKYYAEMLDVYYTQTNVGAGRVRVDRSRAFSSYETLEIKLTNINIEVDPGGRRAVATFDKTFDFQGVKSFSGSVLNRFWLAKTDGTWRITGEKDLKTYYVNR